MVITVRKNFLISHEIIEFCIKNENFLLFCRLPQLEPELVNRFNCLNEVSSKDYFLSECSEILKFILRNEEVINNGNNFLNKIKFY
jgi:hypothetical protein